MAKKVLILLQENSGRIPLPDGLSSNTKNKIYASIDTLAETFEKILIRIASLGTYDQIIDLSDPLCTRANLVKALIDNTLQANTIDLMILGHGSNNSLSLYGQEKLTGGTAGNIRSILTEARLYRCSRINLRMVFMCNCYGSTLNDDWLFIGAKVSIGSRKNNYMPEPMTSIFLSNWAAGISAKSAAETAFELTKWFYLPIYFWGWADKRDQSEPIVNGSQGLTNSWTFPNETPLIAVGDLPLEIRNYPPYLQRVLIAQPNSSETPNGFGSFPSAIASGRYRAEWIDHAGNTRNLLIQSSLLKPNKTAYVFLQFGPFSDGKARQMRYSTLKLTHSAAGSFPTAISLSSGNDAKTGPYYWGVFTFNNAGRTTLNVSLEIEGKDDVPHLTTRSPVGDVIDAQPSTAAFIDFNSPPNYPISNYQPGKDFNHRLTVAYPPATDRYEPNNTFDTATEVALPQTKQIIITDLSLFPAGEADHFKILSLPDAPDRPSIDININNSFLSVQSRYASLEITARVEDLGEAEDDTLLKIYDSSRNLKCTSRQSIVISCPGETFPDHKMYISITNSPPVAVNYTLEIKYNPCTTSTHVNPLRRIRLFELPWEPITHPSPIDAINEIIHRTDLTASVNDLGPEEKIAAASCLIQIAKLAQQVGQNDKAEAILTKAVDIADMAKQIGIKQDALKGLEKIYIKRGDTSKLKEIRNQLNKITVIPR